VIIENDTIILKNNASITLNGIAQGWITDKVVEIINKNNITNTLVDFGETFASGSYESKRPWNIEIQSSEGINTVIKLINKAVATSSASGTMFEPTKKYNHIFNPETGLSTSNFDTVSIISNKAWLSDCIATSALLISRNKLKALCDKLNAKAFISEKNNFKEIV
jgi:thiamine biosynthesis lipoprotein